MNGSYKGKLMDDRKRLPQLSTRGNDEESQLVREDSNPSLCVRIGKNGVMGSGFPTHVRMKCLLVEWACGKGLTVLPPTTSQQ